MSSENKEITISDSNDKCYECHEYYEMYDEQLNTDYVWNLIIAASLDNEFYNLDKVDRKTN